MNWDNLTPKLQKMPERVAEGRQKGQRDAHERKLTRCTKVILVRRMSLIGV
jgi:hypothetical protein